MSEPTKRPAEVDSQIRAINVQWLERKKGDNASELGIKCCRETYDVLARHRQEAMLSLDDSALENQLPNEVFDTAIQKEWFRLEGDKPKIPPPIAVLKPYTDRWIDPRDDWIDTSRMSRSVEPPPQPKPIMVPLGSHKVEQGVMEWFVKTVLAGRIEYWKSARPSDKPIIQVGESENDGNRRADVDLFLQACNEHSAVRVRRRHIWLSVGHSKARQFEYWQARSDNATAEDERNFTRILAMKPVDFVALLNRKSLLPTVKS